MNTFLPYTDEHHALRETARRFIEREVKPHYAQWEKDGQVPKALYRKAGELGLLLTTIPVVSMRPACTNGASASVAAVT